MIVNKLPDILRKAGMTPYRLAKETDEHYRTINRLAKLDKKEISFELLDKICRVLKCQPGDIFKYRRDPSPQALAAKAAAKKAASKKKKIASKKKPSAVRK